MKFDSIFVEIYQSGRQVYKLKDESRRSEFKDLNTEIINKFRYR